MQIVYPRYYLFPVIVKDDIGFNQREEDFNDYYREIQEEIDIFAPPIAKVQDVFEELDEEFVKEFLKE